MADEHKLTRDGYAKLKAEVEDLKGPERRRIAEAIKEAKSHGDLRENAAYHEARLNQRRLEERIGKLEKTLLMAKIIEKPEGAEGAYLGDSLKLKDLDYGDEMNIKLVSSYEADPSQDLISISSPLGAALVGRIPGDEIEVEAPSGPQRYKLLAVE
ncbi:MAG: transcription elongation factor GreA [Fimbriimonadaceae bacterium]